MVDVSWSLLSPELVLGGMAALIILADAIIRGGLGRNMVRVLAIVGLVGAAVCAVRLLGQNTTTLSGVLAVDDYAIYFKLLVIAAAFLVLLTAGGLLRENERHQAEFTGLLLLTTGALMLLASANELITIYLALEMSSLSIALLASWSKRDVRSTEAGLKYFLLSAMASAILLYGMALLYGLTGQTRLDAIAQVLGSSSSPALTLAIALLLAGFGFKISAVPFQFWTPDVYEGAPTPVTAYLSVASKAAGFAVLLRVFVTALGASEIQWAPLLFALAIVTMTLGNIVALVQTNIKRMLAYSSIAQAGYILVGLAATSERGISAVLFYLGAYTLTNLAVFGSIIAVARMTNSERIADLRGLHARAPAAAFGLTVGLLSLAGLPPFVGFFAKLYVFWAAAEAGLMLLVLVGVVNSAISLFYYAQVIHDMYMMSPAEDQLRTTIRDRSRDSALTVAITVAVVGVVLLGVFSGGVLGAQDVAARTLVR